MQMPTLHDIEVVIIGDLAYRHYFVRRVSYLIVALSDAKLFFVCFMALLYL